MKALISEVTASGPAAAAGLKTQDAILQINADKIADKLLSNARELLGRQSS